jgi:inner membrane protein
LLPAGHDVSAEGFRASYRVGNLALGQLLVSEGPRTPIAMPAPGGHPQPPEAATTAASPMAQIDLIQPVDLYSQIARASKYGFLFIGFTFLALLLFDIVGGARVGAAEYLLVGAGLVLFFVLLLAFAEVIGFAPAYLLASGAITALIGFYSAAVLRSRRRAGAVAGLMIVLYGVLYLLLSLEAFSLLIGSVLLFGALASIMYLTRNLDWGGNRAEEAAPSGGLQGIEPGRACRYLDQRQARDLPWPNSSFPRTARSRRARRTPRRRPRPSRQIQDLPLRSR